MVATETKRLTLEDLRDDFLGARIFVLGSGPSLEAQRDEIYSLEKHLTFACNRLNQWEGLRFVPSFYACSKRVVDMMVEPAHPPHLLYKFLIGRKHNFEEGSNDQGWVRVLKQKGVPPAGITHAQPVETGFSQLYICVQIAAWLGFKDICLLGAEQTNKGRVYDLEGTRHEVPPTYKEDWSRLKAHLIGAGRNLTDCTPNGNLNGALGYTPLEAVFEN